MHCQQCKDSIIIINEASSIYHPKNQNQANQVVSRLLEIQLTAVESVYSLS